MQVIDLSRNGAIVTAIKDLKQLKEPRCASVDDFDRVFVWDADAGRAIELGR